MQFRHPRIHYLDTINGTELHVLRVDEIDPIISGNKWYKLKENVAYVKRNKAKGLLTFGGAHSNHLAATAELCRREAIPSIGIIRGEELLQESPTLKFIKQCGMQLLGISRTEYRTKHTEAFTCKLRLEYPGYHLVPEGGANALGRSGCAELAQYCMNFESIACACGTGTMFAGLRAALPTSKQVIGINVLKGSNSLVQDINAVLPQEKQIIGNEALLETQVTHSFVTDQFAFGGYASFDARLWKHSEHVQENYQILLDHIYTSKLFYGIKTLIEDSKLTGTSSILLIHSGGVQGNGAFEERYRTQIVAQK